MPILNFLTTTVFHPDIGWRALGGDKRIRDEIALLNKAFLELIKKESISTAAAIRRISLIPGDSGSPGAQGDPGPIGPAGTPTIEVVATENIPAFEAITVLGQRADSNNTAHLSRVVGLNVAAVVSGFVATVAQSGELTNPAWTWTPGVGVWLNGTTLSQTPPTSGFVLLIGVSKTSTTIVIEPTVAILL